jgi:ethanolamine transporter EutH
MLIIFCQTVTRATASALGIVGPIALEALTASVDMLGFAPVPGLQPIVKALLDIWDAVQEVDVCLLYLTDAYSLLDLS